MRNEQAARKLFKDCFLIGYWLGKAGASDTSDGYLSTRELTVNSKVQLLAMLLEKWRHDEEDGT